MTKLFARDRVEASAGVVEAAAASTRPIPLMPDRDAFKAHTGCEIHPGILDFVPFGRRLVVMREEPLRKYGEHIHIPDSAVEIPARGWVVSVGGLVGSPFEAGVPALGAIPVHRDGLIGTKVLFGAYAGQALLTGDPGEDNYSSRYIVIDEGSIWGMVGLPPLEPLTAKPKEPSNG